MNWSESGRIERTDIMAHQTSLLKGERTTPSQKGSSEEMGRLERPRFCEGFARARIRSLEQTTSEQEGSSEKMGQLK